MKPILIDFPKIQDPRVNLTFIQYPNQIPFEIKRSINCLPNDEANSIADKIIDKHIDAFKELAK